MRNVRSEAFSALSEPALLFRVAPDTRTCTRGTFRPWSGNGSWRWIRRLLLAYSPANHHQHHGRTHPASIRPVRVRIGRLVVGNRHLEWQLATPPSPLGLAVGLACVLCRPSNHARWLAERRELGGFGAPCLGSLIGVWAVIPWQLQGPHEGGGRFLAACERVDAPPV